MCEYTELAQDRVQLRQIYDDESLGPITTRNFLNRQTTIEVQVRTCAMVLIYLFSFYNLSFYKKFL
jgi:hypothetical protein